MKRALAFLIVALIALQPLVGRAQAPDPIQSLIDARVANAPGTGIVAAVVDPSGVHIYHAGSSGTARPLDEHTLFEIGSVTKTFTATVLAQMVLAHTVSLDDPVAKYLPANVRVPSRDGKQITLRNLATQHSGLPRLPDNMRDVTGDNPYLHYGVGDLYRFLDSYHLTRDPGASFAYSNLGVGLLGLALAHAAHRSYEQTVRSYVWQPLGMTETRIALEDDGDRARFAAGHDVDGETVHSWEFTDADAGAGAIRSDITDMVKYLRAVMGEGRLGAAMRFAEKPRADMPAPYRIGLIWWTDTKYGLIEHGGDTAGYHAYVATTSDRSRGVVMLSNGPQVSDLGAHILNASEPLAPQVHTTDLADEQLDEYTGTYADPSAGLTYIVTRQNHELRAQIVGQPAATIYASGPDHFFYRVVQAYITFVRSQGRVAGLVLTQNGKHFPVPKIGADGKPLTASLPSPYAPVVTLDPATLGEYAGTYVFKTSSLTVTVKGNDVFAQIAGQQPYEIFPSAKDEFYYKVVDAQVHFDRDPAGKVASLTLSQNGMTLRYAKNP